MIIARGHSLLIESDFFFAGHLSIKGIFQLKISFAGPKNFESEAIKGLTKFIIVVVELILED